MRGGRDGGGSPHEREHPGRVRGREKPERPDDSFADQNTSASLMRTSVVLKTEDGWKYGAIFQVSGVKLAQNASLSDQITDGQTLMGVGGKLAQTASLLDQNTDWQCYPRTVSGFLQGSPVPVEDARRVVSR